MHDSVMKFGERYLDLADIHGKRVLEVGSYDITAGCAR